MGRGDDLRQLLQPVILRGLLLKHVQRCSTEMTGFDGVGQGALIDQVASRRVDDAQTLLA